jgi:acetoin utilization protein AcuB
MKTAVAMTREVIVIAPEVSLRAAARVMEQRRIRHLPVLKAGRLVGILSDRDVLRYSPRDEGATPGPSCGEAMSPTPITCSPSTPISNAAGLMLEHRIDSLPVLNAAGDLVGLVTSYDLLALLIDRPPSDRLPFDFRLRYAPSDEDLAANA